MKTKIKKIQRARRQKRIRAKIFGTAEMPRLSVFKSNRFISLQLIDDSKGVTLASATTKGRKEKNNTERSLAAGAEIALKAKALGVSAIAFDRGGYIYTGSVAAAAEGARKGGLKF
jgi:large subunit ribosomal protein L18